MPDKYRLTLRNNAILSFQRNNNYMPKLRINAPKAKKKPMPACGHRRNVGTAPISPFQRLIENARLTMSISSRELTKEINSRLKPKEHVNQSTVWFWRNTRNGYPSPRSFKAAHLRALSKVLRLQEDDVRRALDESRAIYSGNPDPTPRPQLDALATLQTTLEQTGKATVRVKWLLHLVKSLRASAQEPATKVKKE